MSIIKVEHLTKDYGNNKGVFDVSFEVESGETFGFLGPNGAGKTTTIRHILGFSKPQKGGTWVSDLNSWEKPEVIQKDLGYLPGEIAFPEGMTGMDLFKMMADLRAMKDLGKADYLINKFQLDPSGLVKKMSKGMKQKTALVAAFMSDPKILVLDEPSTGLDPLMQDVFIDLIIEEKAAGKTILLSSHMFEEVEGTCDRIALIKQGKILTTVIPNDIKFADKKTYKIEFKTGEDYQGMSHEPLAFLEVNPKKNQVRVLVKDEDINDFFKILTKYDMKYMAEIKTTLRDYFMKYYKKNYGNGQTAGEAL
jgi:beta-exotoxin I transport system ATP-binding protein